MTYSRELPVCYNIGEIYIHKRPPTCLFIISNQEAGMPDIDRLKSDIDEIVPDMVALRRDLHEHPELAFEEVRTSGIVAGRLRALGLEVQTGIAKTGVVGTLKGGK